MPEKATLCFVMHKDKIFMQNRVKPPFMGMWNAVGGHLLAGESAEDCAKCEIKEESGVIVDSGKFDWTNGKFPCMTEPDESYHGKAMLCGKCKTMLAVIEKPKVARGYVAIPVTSATF